MAKTKIPDPLARRHYLESDTAADQAQKLAAAYLEAGREIEAIEFLSRAEDHEALAGLQAAAIERGDVFLMKSASAGLGQDPPRERWLALAEVAENAGRTLDAEAARRLAAVDG